MKTNTELSAGLLITLSAARDYDAAFVAYLTELINNPEKLQNREVLKALSQRLEQAAISKKRVAGSIAQHVKLLKPLN